MVYNERETLSAEACIRAGCVQRHQFSNSGVITRDAGELNTCAVKFAEGWKAIPVKSGLFYLTLIGQHPWSQRVSMIIECIDDVCTPVPLQQILVIAGAHHGNALFDMLQLIDLNDTPCSPSCSCLNLSLRQHTSSSLKFQFCCSSAATYHSVCTDAT